MTYISGKKSYELLHASSADIADILKIEDESFVPGIRERSDVFRERLAVNPNGFFILASVDHTLEDSHHIQNNTTSVSVNPANYSNNKKIICGYITTELWKKIPHIIDPESPPDLVKISRFFKLGHSIEQTHCSDGTILYISSMGLIPDFRGLGLGSFLFNRTVQKICAENTAIETVVLMVNELWTGARRIYIKAGFSEFAVLPDFFNNNGTLSNGIIMYADRRNLKL